MSDRTDTSTQKPWTPQFDAEQRSAEWVTNKLWPNGTIEEAALALCEEAGEVARAVIKRNHASRGSGDRAPADWSSNLRRELAQVVVVAMKMAEREGFSLIDMVLLELDALDARREALESGGLRPMSDTAPAGADDIDPWPTDEDMAVACRCGHMLGQHSYGTDDSPCDYCDCSLFNDVMPDGSQAVADHDLRARIEELESAIQIHRDMSTGVTTVPAELVDRTLWTVLGEDSDHAAPASWTRLGLTQAQWEDSDHE